MKLRLTGGRWRGRVVVPKGDGFRPTSSRVREALFSIVGQDLRGRRVLDVCGGSGMLAFEALSRGAPHAVVLERDPGRARDIARVARDLGADVEVVVGPAERWLQRNRTTYDLVLCDPPWADDPGVWLARVAPAVGDLLVLEHATANEPPDEAGAVRRVDRRRYGDTGLSLYRAGDEACALEAGVVLEDDGVVEGEG